MANNLLNSAADPLVRYNDRPLTRHDFPKEFLWGAATSSYQIEGGYKQDSKSLSNWDTWTLNHPEKVAGGDNGCVAIDHYNRIEEDVKTMKKLGIDTYRFSIAWSRILPGGRLSTGVNREGVNFYNKLIDLLLAEGIKPFVTLFHFDVPQSLADEYGAFEDKRIVQDFGEFANVCFYEFGDRVKYWLTMNEPITYVGLGYSSGDFPPGHGPSSATSAQINTHLGHRCHPNIDKTCYGGDARTEPYIVAHHLLLSHARAVQIYRDKYKNVQRGEIGITNVSQWYEPYNQNSVDDQAAATRAVDFQWGWFTEPIITGNYPQVMKDRIGSRLPTFTDDEKILLIGSFDFIGMNYYTTYLAEDSPNGESDVGVTSHFAYPNGTPIGEQAGSTWLYIVPRGIYELLKHNADKYGNPNVYITENGVDEKNERLPISLAINDEVRINYLKDHFAFMKQAIDEKVNVKGYILWSLFDNFEWAEGYTVRFGLYYVDFVNGLTRYPKESAIWYMNFLNKNPPPPNIKRQVIQEIEVENTSVKKKRTRN